MRAGCNPETYCGVTDVEGALGMEYTLNVKALLEVVGGTEVRVILTREGGYSVPPLRPQVFFS